MMNNDEGASPTERVAVDTPLEKKGKLVGFDMGEIQQRVARMQELEGKTLPEQSKQIVALKRELETTNQEYKSIQEDVDMGIASFADLQRFDALQSELQATQLKLAEAESSRAESRRELSLLNPEEHGDLYQLERAQAESAKTGLKKAFAEMDEEMIDKIKGQINKKSN